jgi:hypothetical protein
MKCLLFQRRIEKNGTQKGFIHKLGFELTAHYDTKVTYTESIFGHSQM